MAEDNASRAMAEQNARAGGLDRERPRGERLQHPSDTRRDEREPDGRLRERGHHGGGATCAGRREILTGNVKISKLDSPSKPTKGRVKALFSQDRHTTWKATQRKS